LKTCHSWIWNENKEPSAFENLTIFLLYRFMMNFHCLVASFLACVLGNNFMKYSLKNEINFYRLLFPLLVLNQVDLINAGPLAKVIPIFTNDLRLATFSWSLSPMLISQCRSILTVTTSSILPLVATTSRMEPTRIPWAPALLFSSIVPMGYRTAT